MADADLQAEVDKLRAQVEAYRQRELDDLKAQLATAIAERDNYRNEAYRNAEVGRQIADGLQEEINRLRSQLEVKEQVSRSLRSANGANASRN